MCDFLFQIAIFNKLIRKYYLCKVKAHQGDLFLGPEKTVLTRNTILGKNPSFNGLIIQGEAEVRFGDNFHSGGNCRIIPDSHNYEGEAVPYDNTMIRKNVTIGNNVWLGYGVTILGGVKIGDGAIIQAGALVVNDVPYCAIAGGVPAKPFKYRNVEHYEKLVLEGKFH